MPVIAVDLNPHSWPVSPAVILCTVPILLPFLSQKPLSGKRHGLTALRKILSMINRSSDVRTILEAALDEAMDVLGMDAGLIRLQAGEGAGSVLFVYRGLPVDAAAEIERGSGSGNPSATADENDRPLVVKDLSRHNEHDAIVRALRGEGMQVLALYPIKFGNRVIGSIALARRRAGSPTEQNEEFLSALTEVLGSAVGGAQLHDHAEKLAEDLITLQEVNKIISQSFNLEDIIRRIVIEGKRLVKSSQCHLFLLDERLQRLDGSASTQAADLDIGRVSFELSETSPAVRALVGKKVITVSRTPQGSSAQEEILKTMKWSAALFAPMLYQDQTIGVLICSEDSVERQFTQEEILRAETLAHQAAIALENARLFHVVSRSQKEWETTFDAMQDCVSVHDTGGCVVRANLALARKLKTAPPGVIGKHCCEIYNSAGHQPAACRHTAALETEPLLVEELELPAMGGTFQLSVSPWYDKNNRLAGSIHVAKDISHEKLLQQQLIQSEKLSAIGELISGIAHELNNPLTGVMGYSQLLQLRKDIDERARDSLLKINNLALRCQRIVQNLLSFARKQKPERICCDVNDILEKTVELRSYELQVNNIEIVRQQDRSLSKTIADGHQLQQVFLNVITNAEHAMLEAHGKGILTIRTHTDASKNRIIIEIVDDGPGIPEAHLTRIFDPFFTTKEVGKGTGLGLSLSYGIIKEHGGNIYARSRIGEGSTFVIEIPITTQILEETGLPPQLLPQAIHFENLIRNKRILVVDDEKYILDFFVEVFRMFPMEVHTADDGKIAMEKILCSDYDLVFTDFKMPNMSGRELFHWIESHRPKLLSKIIFVTGDTVSPETRSFFETTGNRYLAKPFKIEEVKEVIQQTLETVTD
jgi:two-component system NtrC family sensor kinase